jgi:hypothetical protein
LGITPEWGLAVFDGEDWSEETSWAFHAVPEGVSLEGANRLSLAPDGALWLRTEGAVARFDPQLAADHPDQAWTVYPLEGDLAHSYLSDIALGPGGEVWIGAARLKP